MTSVVTNIADLTPAMCELLRHPGEPDHFAEAPNRITLGALANRGLVTIISGTAGQLTYRLTAAGKRCRAALERQDAPTVAVREIASYGWALLSEHDFGGHAITTWIRDGHTLVLSWMGDREVSAAIYDGVPLPLDKLVQAVMSEDEGDTLPEYVLHMAARRAFQVANPKHAHELGTLLNGLAHQIRRDGSLPLSIRTAASQLAVAILATPPRTS